MPHPPHQLTHENHQLINQPLPFRKGRLKIKELRPFLISRHLMIRLLNLEVQPLLINHLKDIMLRLLVTGLRPLIKATMPRLLIKATMLHLLIKAMMPRLLIKATMLRPLIKATMLRPLIKATMLRPLIKATMLRPLIMATMLRPLITHQ